VNYVRALQGVNGKTVVVGPLAPPGVTGDKVPGATEMGPTRPAPYFNPRSELTGVPAAAESPAAAAQQGLAPATPRTDSTPRPRVDSTRAKKDSLRSSALR
jgi:hypothetical protein